MSLDELNIRFNREEKISDLEYGSEKIFRIKHREDKQWQYRQKV